MSFIISVDLGTTKICVAAVDLETLKPLTIVSCLNNSDVAEIDAQWHEQHPQKIWQTVLALIRQLLEECPAAADSIAVSISGQMHGVMLVNSDTELLGNFITWRDHRGHSFAYEDADTKRVGCCLHPGYGGATLSWFAHQDLIPDGAKALSLADYIAAKFSGVLANEATHAASWGIFDIHTNAWDRELISRLGIPEKVFCEVRHSASKLEKINRQLAAELNLSTSMIVCSPVGDNQASVIGAAGFDASALVLNLGTGGQVSIPDNAGRFIEGFETRPMPGGGFIHVGASLCGGWSYAYLKNFCKELIKQVADVELSDDELYTRLNQLAGKSAVSKNELFVDTRFAGVRGDDRIRGSIQNINTTNFTIDNLSYAFLEGMVKELYQMAQSMLGNIRKVIASGNAVRKNSLMPAIIARVFGFECKVSSVQEEAVIGAAIASAMELGLLRRDDINQLLRTR
jgi:sedoheptulokinase